jgi:GAF domain-containing protein
MARRHALSDPAPLHRRRLERLQGLSAALAGALTPNDVAQVIFEQGFGIVEAKSVYLYVERPGGTLELVQGFGLPEVYVAAHQVVAPGDPLPVAEAYRTGAPVWLGSPAEIAGRYPGLADAARAEGDLAMAALPLATERTRGAIGLAFDAPRPFGAAEREFVLAVARQCAQAIERARLYEAQRKLAERLGQLQSTAAALAGAATPREVADIAFRALAGLGASAAEFHAVDGREHLRLVVRHGPGVGAHAPSMRLDEPHPAAEVVRTGRALWLAEPDEVATHGGSPDASGRPVGALAAVPLLAGGDPVGALVVAFPGPRALQPDERSFVRLVAQPCAQALERARLFELAGRTRAEAQRSAAVLDELFRAAPVGLALLDREMRYVRVNRQLAEMNGIPADAHLGKTPLELLPGLPGEKIAEAFRKVVATGAPMTGLVVVGETAAAPGTTGRWVNDWYPVRLGNEIVGVGVLVRALDARKDG